MKRIRALLVLTAGLILCARVCSQADTISMDMLPEATTLNAADKFWILQSGVDKYIEKQNFIHWNTGTGTLYVPDITRRVGIGTTTPTSGYLLDVKGNILISSGGYLKTTGRIYIGDGSWIRESYNNLEFYDPYYGSTVSLSELAAGGGATLNSGSGITIDGSNNIDLYGSLTETANINTGSHNFYVNNSVGGTNCIQLSTTNATMHGGDLSLIGRSAFALSGDSMSLRSNVSINKFIIEDKRYNPNRKGLEYYADYSASIKSNIRSIPDIGTMCMVVRDTLGDIYFKGDTIYSNTGAVRFDGTLYMLGNALWPGNGAGYIRGLDNEMIFYNNGTRLSITASAIKTHVPLVPNEWSDYIGASSPSLHYRRAYIDTLTTADDDTYIALSTEKIKFFAEDEQTLTITKDSLVALDTLYCKYLVPPTEYGWAVIDSASGALFADSLADASFGLTDDLLPIDEYLKDTKNGELKWYYTKDKFSYGLKGRKPTEAVTALMWQTEQLLRRNEELEKKNKELNNRLTDIEKRLDILGL